eukprot:19221_1
MMSNNESTCNQLLFKSALATSVAIIAFKLFNSNSIGSQNKFIEEKNDNIRAHWSYEVLNNEQERSMTDLKVLFHSTDHFNGVRINADKLPLKKSIFKWKLEYSLEKWKKEEKRGIFLKIPIKLSSYLEIALLNGFIIHHARPSYIMLTKWIPTNEMNMIPDYCHTYIACGCFIVNKYKQVAVIQEIWNHGRKDHWKLPGGAIDRLENIFDAAMRETKEETGLDTEFKGILQFRHFYPFRFTNSGDIYYICLLKYNGILDDGNEFKIDENEIDEIKWMDVDKVLELESQQPTFGSQQCKDNIKRNVDILVKNWDKHNENEYDINLQTFRPTKYKFNNHKLLSKYKQDREWYVYAPVVSNS